MSITLQAIVLVAAVVALSVVAVDSLDIWEWEKFAQNDGTVSEYTADKSVYASDADAEKSATISVTGTATASVDPDIFTVRLGVSTQDKNAGMALSSNSERHKFSAFGGLDSLVSMSEMPTGSPVACVGVNKAENAGIYAAKILANEFPDIAVKLVKFKNSRHDEVLEESEKMRKRGIKKFSN